MYKCKECGAEYKEKPDYCDCGNDEFEEIIPKVIVEKREPAKTYKKPENNIQKTVKPAKTEKPKYEKRSFEEQYPSLNRFIHSLEPISTTIFCVCILLSFYVVFFAWNPEEAEIQVEKTQETTVSKNIPSIDKFWNNALPVVKQPEQKIEVQPKQEPVKEIIPKPVQQQPKVTKVPLVKNSSIKPVQKQVSTRQNQIKKQQEEADKKKAEQAKLAAETAKKKAEQGKLAQELAKKKAEQQRQAAEAAQLKKLQEEAAKKQAAEKAKRLAVSKQELVSYKANLRNTIGRKIDFTRVIGDGSCTVAFRIDKNGKLTNRSFAKQSTNNTLNDAVYNAVMSTPTFNPPPEAYNNEVLNLNISFKNGNFEISLP